MDFNEEFPIRISYSLAYAYFFISSNESEYKGECNLKGIGKTILIIGVLVAFGVGAYYFGSHYLSGDESADKEEIDEEIEQSRERAKKDVTEEDIAEYEKEGLNPFGEAREQQELTEEHYQEYIHGMSHQKVKANEKWGFYLITQERIEWLLDGLENVDFGSNETIYQDILSRWAEGDFTQADQDHNKIWRMQGGTVGEAYGILSEEEEQAYIQQAREGSVER